MLRNIYIVAIHFLKKGPTKYLIVILSLYLLLAIVNAITIPIWEISDEPTHFYYAQYLSHSDKERLQNCPKPLYLGTTPFYYYLISIFVDKSLEPVVNSYIYKSPSVDEKCRRAIHQKAIFPNQAKINKTVLCIRFLSIIMGTITIISVFSMALLIFPARLDIVIIAAGLISTIPTFDNITAGVNNDNLATMASTLTLLYLTKVAVSGLNWNNTLFTGFWCGVALGTKVNTLYLIIAIPLLLSLCMLSHPYKKRLLVKFIVVIFAVVLVISGWWYINNIILYGEPVVIYSFGKPPPNNILYHLRSLGFVFKSFWAVFGYLTIFYPATFYFICGFITLLAIFGLLLRIKIINKFHKYYLCYMGICIITQFLLGIAYYLRGSFFVGRYLYPTIYPIGILLSVGLSHFLPSKFPRETFAVIGIIFLWSLNLMFFITVVIPGFY